MQIKIQCQCGTRYAFEIEPVNGAMPACVNCPTCGADGTEAANSRIKQQLAATQTPQANLVPTRQPIRIARFGAAPAPAMAVPTGAPGPAPAPPSVEAEPAGLCPKHRQEPASET